MDLVSIIIPVYNSEQYIDRCLNSLLNQTYKNIELIIVDDGSIDNSLLLIYKYAKRDKRIRIHKQKNSGPSIARNNGIDIAKGTYLLFCDSDDYVENYYVEILINQIQKLGCDIVACGYTDISKYGKFRVNDFYKAKEELSREIFTSCIFKGTGGTLWGKIFKRDLIVKNNIKLKPDIYMSEDMIFVLEYCMICKSYGSVEENLYYYNRLNENSISSKMNIEYYNILFNVIENIEFILSQNKFHESYIDDILSERIKNIAIMFLLIQNNKAFKYSKKEKYNNIQTILENRYLKKYKANFISNKVREIIMILLIKKNKVVLINYYSNILCKLQLLKNKIKSIE